MLQQQAMAPGTPINGGKTAPPPVSASVLQGIKKQGIGGSGSGSGNGSSSNPATSSNAAAGGGLVPKQFEVRASIDLS